MKHQIASKPRVRRMVIAAAVAVFVGSGMLVGVLPMHKHPVLAVETAPEAPLPDSTKAQGIRVLALANTFRVTAAGDVDLAMNTFATPEFKTDWSARNEVLSNHSFPWEDFYGAATIFVGRMADGKASAIFYNPWVDIVIITGVDLEKEKVFEGIVLTGETLRGEAFSRDNAATPAWMREPNSLAVALGKVYVPTAKAIDRLFPPTATYTLLPEYLAERMGASDEEFAAFVVRQLDRSKMFSVLLSPETDGQKALQSAVVKVLTAVNKGDRTEFDAGNFGKQRSAMTENIFELPTEVRSQMSPIFLFSQRDGAVAALVNPAWPQWFITIHMEGAQDDIAVGSVEIYKFELLHLLN